MTSFLRQSVPLSVLLMLAACGGDAAQEEEQEEGAIDPAREEQKSALDACGYAEPCATASYTYGMDPNVRDCMIDALASGAPVHFSITNIPDGGGHCSAMHEIYVGSDGTVITWWRGDSDCSQDPADTFYRYELKTCTLAERSFFETCLETEPVPPYDSCDWGTWYSDCVPLDAPFCS